VTSEEVELTNEAIDRGLKAWDRTIEVQQHFNDIEMRIRNYALTLLAALVGGVGLALQTDRRSVAVALLIGALAAWFAFYLMDRFWYHPLLKGAVNHALKLERELKPYVPGIGLATAIGDASPIILRAKSQKPWKIRSPRKMDIFYAIFALAIIVFLVLVLTGIVT
jgi:hypothetical protein